jgi:hypothetical protein
MRGSYSGNTSAFQADAESSILLPRSKQHGPWMNYRFCQGFFFLSRCSLVRLKAPALGAGDREFESHPRDQFSPRSFNG